MLGRVYTVAIGSQAQTAAKTLIEIAAPADAVVFIERIWIRQTSFDTAEALGVKVEDVTTTGTGTATTPVPAQEGDAAFGGTVKTDLSAEPTYSGTVHLENGFNVLDGFDWTPLTDDHFIVISPSQIKGISLDVAPSGSMDFSYGCVLREIGG